MTMNTWPPLVGTWAYDMILWLWSVASGYPVFDYNDMDVKHRLQATTLAKKLTFHIDCPVVRMDRRTSMSWLPKFLGWINYPVGEGGGGGVLPYVGYIGRVPPHLVTFFCPFLVWKRVYTLPILVWNRVWFLRELRECMNVFIISIPNE